MYLSYPVLGFVFLGFLIAIYISRYLVIVQWVDSAREEQKRLTMVDAINHDHTLDMELKISELQEERDNLESIIHGHETESEELQEELEEANEKVQALESKITFLYKELDGTYTEIDGLENPVVSSQ